MIFSSVAHAALFAVALVGFSQTKAFEEHQEAVPVEIINENELRQMMRGERNAPKPLPAPQQKADRVAEVNERKPDAPLAKQEVDVPPPPQRDSAAEKAAQEKAAAAQREKEAQKEAQEQAAREARAAAERQRIASAAAAAAAAVEKARAAAAEKARAEAEAKKEEEAEERREAELERQRKQEEARKAAEAKKIADEKKAAEDKKRKEAEAKALKDKLEREEEEAEERKQAELDKQKKAEEARKAAEAKKAADAKRAADEKAKREAETKQAAQSDQKSFDPSDIRKLLDNKQRAATTGSTGPQPQQQASLGTQTGSAAKLNPSQREALIGILREQMTRCLSIPPGSNPSARPTLRVALNQDGSLNGAPSQTGGDAAVGAASIRAIRACAPYRIPPKFAEFYGDWRSLQITIDVSDL